MRDGWTETTLGEAATLIMGQSPPGSSYNDRGEGLPFLQGSAEFGSRHPVPVKWCSEPRRVAQPGDVLVSVRAPVGDLNVAETETAIGRGLAIVRGGPYALTDFLMLAIEAGVDELLARSGAGMFTSITKDGLASLPIVLPSLVVQRRVVDLVDAVDTYATTAQAGRLGVERAYLAVLVEQYGDLLATAPAEAFAAVAQSRLGKMLSKASKTGAAEHTYLRNANVQWDELRLDDLNTMSFSKSEQAEFSLRAGDLLVCEGGEVGRAALVVEDLPQVFFQKALHRVRCGDRLLPRFLLHYLRYCAETGGFRDLATAMTIQHLTGEKLKTLPVPVPPLDQQQALVDVLDASLQLGHRSDHVVETVMALRSALLGELLSGDREVPESYDDLVGVA